MDNLEISANEGLWIDLQFDVDDIQYYITAKRNRKQILEFYIRDNKKHQLQIFTVGEKKIESPDFSEFVIKSAINVIMSADFA